jgi:prolyl oligopeptidase
VAPGQPYPATLLATAESDSRVATFHARKMAAVLQERTASAQPILLHVETKAGHGKGKPVSKRIDECTDWLVFVMDQLEM